MPGRIILAFTSLLCPAGPVSSNGARIKTTMNGNGAIPSIWSQYLAVRVWYERELVQKACAESAWDRGQCRGDFSPHSKLRSLAFMHEEHGAAAALRAAWRLTALAKALEIDATVLMDTAPEDLRVLLRWIDDFPESEHGPVWLKAFETGYQEELISQAPVQR